jgi:P27 family predicted phage terminase small subunit
MENYMNFEPPEPPVKLTLPARVHWDRLTRQLHMQGRLTNVSADLLASFCQLLQLSQECIAAILADGVMVAGARSERERVRHPLWTPYSQAQANLIRLAKAIPLMTGAVEHSELDSEIDEILGKGAWDE